MTAERLHSTLKKSKSFQLGIDYVNALKEENYKDISPRVSVDAITKELSQVTGFQGWSERLAILNSLMMYWQILGEEFAEVIKLHS